MQNEKIALGRVFWTSWTSSECACFLEGERVFINARYVEVISIVPFCLDLFSPFHFFWNQFFYSYVFLFNFLSSVSTIVFVDFLSVNFFLFFVHSGIFPSMLFASSYVFFIEPSTEKSKKCYICQNFKFIWRMADNFTYILTVIRWYPGYYIKPSF